MLAILSANGEGVPQSWPVAMRYACMAIGYHWTTFPPNTLLAGVEGVEDAILGGRGRVLAIDRAMKGGAVAGNFDGCDHPLDDSGLDSTEVDACANFRERKIIGTVVTRYADRRGGDHASYGTADAFNDLLVSDAFALHAMTIAMPAIFNNAASERSQYDAVSKDIAARTYPALGAADLVRLDADLNRLYKDMKCELGCDTDSAMADAFQEAQRSWLRYRDAMVSDTVGTAPPGAANSVKTAVTAQLTRDRVDTFERWVGNLQGGHPVSVSLLSGSK
ncbi:lysozyme inhibitor LprI family protein [uncultured Sphingomonas sp.]|uniref:lysozyme inhibitor LprI family protein n=1 Tax=uncultured Sphingomonas sp. TaxID=158754 RepID=UPI0035C97810